MGGDTLPILDSILATGTGYVCCPAETDQQGFMEEMKSHSQVFVRINVDPGPITTNDFDALRGRGGQGSCPGRKAAPAYA